MITVKKFDNVLNYTKLLSLVKSASPNIYVYKGCAESSTRGCAVRATVGNIPDGSYRAEIVPGMSVILHPALFDVDRVEISFEPYPATTDINVLSANELRESIYSLSDILPSKKAAGGVRSSQGAGTFTISHAPDGKRAIVRGENVTAVFYTPERTVKILIAGITESEHAELKSVPGKSVSQVIRERIREGLSSDIGVSPSTTETLRTMADLTGQTVNDLIMEAINVWKKQ